MSLGSSRSPGGGASGGDLAGAGGAGGSGNGGEEDPDLFTQNFQVKFRFSDGRVVEGWSEYAFDRFDEYMATLAEVRLHPLCLFVRGLVICYAIANLLFLTDRHAHPRAHPSTALAGV